MPVSLMSRLPMGPSREKGNRQVTEATREALPPGWEELQQRLLLGQ